MCEYCSNENGKPLLYYDNRSVMNVYCDQYQGVSASAVLGMAGNTLELSASGSYRSQSDCYYEAEGLEIDSKYSRSVKPSYIRIQYCPFCGRKLESKLFEKICLEDKIENLERDLCKYKEDFSELNIAIRFSWKYTEQKHPGYEYGTEEYKAALKKQCMKLSEIINRNTTIDIDVWYGKVGPGFGSENEITYNIDEKLRCVSCWGTKYETDWYYTDEKMLNKLQKMGLIKRISRKDIKEMNEQKEFLTKQIIETENNIKDLKQKLKSKNY